MAFLILVLVLGVLGRGFAEDTTTLSPFTTPHPNAATNESCDFSDVHNCNVEFDEIWQPKVWTNKSKTPVPNRGGSFLELDVMSVTEAQMDASFVNFAPSVSQAGANFTLSFFALKIITGNRNLFVVKQGGKPLFTADWEKSDERNWKTITVQLDPTGEDEITIEFASEAFDCFSYIAIDYLEVDGMDQYCYTTDIPNDSADSSCNVHYSLWKLVEFQPTSQSIRGRNSGNNALVFRPSSHTPEQVAIASVTYGVQPPVAGICLTLNLYVQYTGHSSVSINDSLIVVNQGQRLAFTFTANNVTDGQWNMLTRPLMAGQETQIRVKFFAAARESIDLIAINYFEETACREEW